MVVAAAAVVVVVVTWTNDERHESWGILLADDSLHGGG